MFQANKANQLDISNHLCTADADYLARLEKQWPGIIRNNYLLNIDEEKFACLFSDGIGRPNVPVNVMVTALILQERFGLTDQELSDFVYGDLPFQYALGVNELSVRSIERFRERLDKHWKETKQDLLKTEVVKIALKTGETMGISFGKSRMDSIQIEAHSAWLSRLGLVYRVNAQALQLMDRLGARDSVPQSLHHYLEPDDENRVIYHNDTDSNEQKIRQAVSDAGQIRKLMEEPQWAEYQEYKNLVRVLEEQSTKDSEGNTTPKAKEELKASSMQNPSDPDATYRKKAGKDHKGYVGNVEESYEADGRGVIINFDVQPNVYSDIDFLRSDLEKRLETVTEDTPWKIMVVDGAYFSLEILELAKKAHVRIMPTALTGKETDEVFANFVMNGERNQVVRCPKGHCPIQQSYNEKTGTCRCVFDGTCCANCPYRENCGAKMQKSTAVVMVTWTKIARATVSLQFSSEDSKKYARERNAVEGVMSVLRRRYHVDEMPAYGLSRVGIFFALKVAAYNLRKLEIFYKKEARKGRKAA